jgi:hypothetical protein
MRRWRSCSWLTQRATSRPLSTQRVSTGAESAFEGPQLNVAIPERTSAVHHVLLCSARIAEGVAHGRVPDGRALFLLAAAVVDAASHEDLHAVELGLSVAVGLRKTIPPDAKWKECRGHLEATMEFAWLLLRKEPAGLNDSKFNLS